MGRRVKSQVMNGDNTDGLDMIPSERMEGIDKLHNCRVVQPRGTVG